MKTYLNSSRSHYTPEKNYHKLHLLKFYSNLLYNLDPHKWKRSDNPTKGQIITIFFKDSNIHKLLNVTGSLLNPLRRKYKTMQSEKHNHAIVKVLASIIKTQPKVPPPPF